MFRYEVDACVLQFLPRPNVSPLKHQQEPHFRHGKYLSNGVMHILGSSVHLQAGIITTRLRSHICCGTRLSMLQTSNWQAQLQISRNPSVSRPRTFQQARSSSSLLPPREMPHGMTTLPFRMTAGTYLPAGLAIKNPGTIKSEASWHDRYQAGSSAVPILSGGTAGSYLSAGTATILLNVTHLDALHHTFSQAVSILSPSQQELTLQSDWSNIASESAGCVLSIR